MRAPSRRLPPLPPSAPPRLSARLVGWSFLAAIAGALGAFVWRAMMAAWQHPGVALVVLSIFAALCGLVTLAEDYPPRRLKRLIHSRPAEGALCRFARDFDCRGTDTWLIRAVFEEVQGCLSEHHPPIPIRAGDRLVDLGLDTDDRDEIATNTAIRTGYSLDQNRSNPLYDKVESVGGIVEFLQLQPCIRQVHIRTPSDGEQFARKQ